MKQIILQKGEAILHDVPLPTIQPGMVLIRNYYSIISTGTEAGSVAFSKKSLLAKIFSEREKMAKGMRMLKEKGFARTYEFVKGMLDFGMEVGYSSSGEVITVGAGVVGFSKGDRVACAGAQYAHHAEYVLVPKNLVAKVPDGVSYRSAASTTLGAIALQGIRQAEPTLGETVLVVGLGLLGQLTVQMLRASGCTVFGVDINESRIELARKYGLSEGFLADDAALVKKIIEASGGRGVDRTLITASSPSSAILNTAMEYTRKRGRIVIVGVVGMNLNRSPWYEKEIDIRISTSYGPGRYDPTYEAKGCDYPIAYVRWTEQRNMEAYLSLLQKGVVDFDSLVDHEFAFEDAQKAYETLSSRPLAIALRYDEAKSVSIQSAIQIAPVSSVSGVIRLGVIGLGNFALSTHLPNISRMKDRFALSALVTHSPARAKQYGLQYNASRIGTDSAEIIADPSIDAVLIATRHDSHARLACEALRAGKHVFLEKPLAMNEQELLEVEKCWKESGRILMVGFNRRFSLAIQAIMQVVKDRKNPLSIIYRVNAGFLPADHWTQGEQGGGRMIGEGCHMLDVFVALINSPVARVSCSPLRNSNTYSGSDTFSATIEYADGSIATLHYISSGNPSLAKEYVEVYSDGNVYVIDDYKELKGYSSRKITSVGKGKGHIQELEVFASALKSGVMPIPFEDLRSVTETSIQIDSLARGV
ncbi:MAG: bi-domain-containing oxidoreductase [bacterium]|nr:bi-domain-containing oxidoreductase [bacterium]